MITTASTTWKGSDGVSDFDWEAWRRHFPDLATVTYLNTSSHGAKSDRVQAALRAYAESWTADPPWETEWRQVVRGAETRFARSIGAAGRDVVMVPSLTDAFHRSMSAIDDDVRTRVVLGAREWVSLQHATAAWPGIVPVVVDAGIEPDDDAFLDRIDDDTRLLVVSHVCYQTGYRADLRRVVDRAHEVGAKVFVDAFQSAGVVPIDVEATPVDFLSAGALKYLLGVPGAAFLYVHPSVSAERTPYLSGWRGQREPMMPDLDPAQGAARFGSGTWAVPNAFAASAGLDLIEDAGIGRIAERVDRITSLFQSELDAAGIPTATPRESAKRAGIVAVPMHHAAETLEELRLDGIIASERGGSLRFSFHAYNTEKEARAVAQRLAQLTANRKRHA